MGFCAHSVKRRFVYHICGNTGIDSPGAQKYYVSNLNIFKIRGDY